MLFFAETAVEKHRLKAECFINHFLQTRPYGMVPNSPRILVPASSLGLAFGVPKIVTSKFVNVVVYDLWTGDVYGIVTSRMYHKFLTNRGTETMNINSGLFHCNKLYVSGRFKTDTQFFIFCFNFTKLTCDLVCVFNSDSFVPVPLISTGSFLHVFPSQQGTCIHWAIPDEENTFLPPVTSLRINNVELIIGDMLHDDIDGRCCLYDKNHQLLWQFSFCNMIMEQIYCLNLKPLLIKENTAEQQQNHLSYKVVQLKSNLNFNCTPSIEYSKCFLRNEIVYWFIPGEKQTEVWELNLNSPETSWFLMPDILPCTVIDPAFDEETDSLFMYCATVDHKTEDYPWDPCFLKLRRAYFTFPTLQQLSIAKVGAFLNFTKLSESDLTQLCLPRHIGTFLWYRSLILKHIASYKLK